MSEENIKPKILIDISGRVVVDASHATALLAMMDGAEVYSTDGYGSNMTIKISPLAPDDGITIQTISNAVYQIAKMAHTPEE